MQGKTLYTILLSIIAVLTLALAVLVIFMFTAYNGGNVEPNATSINAEVPLEQQQRFKLYEDDEVFRLKESKNNVNSYLMTNITIVYNKGKEKEKVAETRKTLIEQTLLSELKEATIEYFASKTIDEIKADDAMQQARDSLLEKYNSIISSNPDDKLIIKVVFEKWIPQ